MDFKIKGGIENADIKIEKTTSNGIIYIDVKMSLQSAQVPEEFSVEWEFPVTESYSVWNYNLHGSRCLLTNWGSRKTDSRLASGLPVHQILSYDGRNRMCVSLSDAMIPTRISTGVIEENANLKCKASFFTGPTSPISEYSAKIRIDTRDISYYDSLYDTACWWETDCGYVPAKVPDAAKMPMDSLWYSFHQQLSADEIVKECAESAKLGMETVIIDDGWQTDDNSRGYAYCGDWKVAPGKMGDMAKLVDRIHALGMKVMLWYSVPFVGIHSEKYEKFKGMYLNGDKELEYYTLDPRYKEVRDYLVGVYTDSVKNFGLDGLKLDFIDSFILTPKSMEYDEKRDYSSLEDAVDALMISIREALTEINPEILIEFRQSYIGPAIRKYGNMIRVADCPNDALVNRRNIVDLRYTSGATAVHSDMLMWNKDDTPESAALQFVSVLYGVPQISVKISELSEQHAGMLKFYLSFWRKYKDILLDGKLEGFNPESDYSLVRSTLGECCVVTAYTDPLIYVETKKAIAVNGTRHPFLILKNCAGKRFKTVNCMGDVLEEGIVSSSLCEISVPMSGMIFVNC